MISEYTATDPHSEIGIGNMLYDCVDMNPEIKTFRPEKNRRDSVGVCSTTFHHIPNRVTLVRSLSLEKKPM